MSYSAIRIKKDTVFTNDFIRKLDVDTDNIVKYIVTQVPTASIKQVVAPNQQGTYIQQIVVVEEDHSTDKNPFDIGDYIYVTYHHATDPTLFEVIVEIDMILKSYK